MSGNRKIRIPTATRISRLGKRASSIIILLAVVGVVVTFVFLRDRFVVTEAIGYPSVALLSFVANASLILPVPGLAVVCTGGWLLSPLLVALVATVPASLGELTGYAAGYGGSGFATKGRLYHRMVGLMRRRGWLVLFVLSAVPNPVFDIAGVAAGALRYPLPKFLAILCVGKLIKFVAIAYACQAGIEGVRRFFHWG